MTMASQRDSSLTQEDNEHCLNAKNIFKTDKIKQQQTKKIKLKKWVPGSLTKTQLQQEPVKKHG